jgi:acyl transferase domain-containing protein
MLSQALQAIEALQAKLAAAERSRSEPIAIVGLACRFPGAPSAEAYWDLLANGRDAVTEVPPDRWHQSAYFDPDPAAPGKMHAPFGGFLADIALFDAAFFGISGREAESMDPQQRLMLEVAWEALENAAIEPDRLGASTGVFVGITTTDYARLAISGPAASFDVYTATGGALNAAAGRIAYTLGLNGPAVAVDTACSSSLVAVHLACQSLRTRECDAAIAGGVNVLLTPEPFVCFAKWGMMAPDGHCKTFDERADGFVRSEGCGVVVLKRLSDAQAAGDRILAVIRGTAVNQDGASSGLTVPNGLAQQAVVRSALKSASVDALAIDYIEAHGTGTKLGDPIELEALAEVLCKRRPAGQPLIVGSVKTNIGHAESASGVAGLIKVVLSMAREQIPAHLHFNKLNPRISLRGAPVEIPTRPTPWPRSARARFAGVSAFGFSGTNAHVVVEEAPVIQRNAEGNMVVPTHLLVLSARTEAGLRGLAGAYAERFEQMPENIGDLCHTAAVGRAALPMRLATVVSRPEEAAQALAAYAAGRASANIFTGQEATAPKVAFLFPGQGSQYFGMGRSLYEFEPVFRDAFDRCAEIVRLLNGQDLRDIVGFHGASVPSADLNETRHTQPALFSFEYALAQLWLSWGIRPTALLGHSLGEYVAACVAGAVTLQDVLRLVVVRADLMQALPPDGAMVAVFAAEAPVRAALSARAATVAVAAVNTPENTVIAGRREDVEAVVEELLRQGMDARPLTVSHAFHSPLVEPMLDALERASAGIAFTTPQIEVISNVTGAPISPAAPFSPQYWRRHARDAVRFADGIRTLQRRGIDAFIEIGPVPVLLGMARQSIERTDVGWLPSMRRDQDVRSQLLSSLGELFARGARVDWDAFNRPRGHRRVDAPRYPFQRKRFWLPEARVKVGEDTTNDVHPLLGRRVVSPLGETLYECRLDLAMWPVLREHRVAGLTLLPASAYIELGRAAAADVFGTIAVQVEAGVFKAPLILDEEPPRDVRVVVKQVQDGTATFEIFSRGRQATANAAWVSHAGGRLVRLIEPRAWADTPAAARDRCDRAVDVAEYQRRMADVGLEYGPSFRALVAASRGADREAFGELRLPDGDALARQLALHPGMLDAAFHLLGVALDKDDSGRFYLPIGFEGAYVERPLGREARAHVRLRVADPLRVVADITLWCQDGALAGRILGLQARAVSREQFRVALGADETGLLRVAWRPAPESAAMPPRGSWHVLGGDAQLAMRVSAAIARYGCGVEMLSTADIGAWLDRLRTGAHDIGGIVDLRGTQLPSLDASHINTLPTGAVRDSAIEHSLELLRAAAAVAPSAAGLRIVLVTRHAQATSSDDAVDPLAAVIWGMVSSAATETPAIDARLVDIDGTDAADHLAAAALRVDRETRLAVRDGRVLAARLVRVVRGDGTIRVPNSPYGIAMRERTLDGLVFEPHARRVPGAGQVEIEVLASGVNFRDVLNLLDMYPGPPSTLGNECCGRVVAVGPGVEQPTVGTFVACIAEATFSSHVLAEAALTFPVPASLSLSQASVLPIAHLTAYLALHEVGRLEPGDRVLVHAGAGGVGLAAIHIALAAGAEVYASAGSEHKRGYLRGLGVRAVFDSRSALPAAEMRSAAGGQGFDLVLNSLTGAFIDEGLAALAPGGRFLEIGLRELRSAEQVAAARSDVSYHALLLGDVCRKDPATVQRMYREVASMLEAGRIPPPLVRKFPIAEAGAAFRFMAKARHIGRIAVVHPVVGQAARADVSYLLSGGLGALGLHAADWLASRGARHLVLLGRSAPSDEAQRRIAALTAQGVAVRVIAADIANADAIGEEQDWPPLAGIVHAAGIVDDALLAHTDVERLIRVLRPKADGAINLARVVGDRDLDFFVLFSSGSALLGSSGQVAYAGANSFLDAFAAQQRGAGRAALSIGWGAWEDGGMAARVSDRVKQDWAARGVGTFATADAIRALETALGMGFAHVAALPIDWHKFFARQQPDAVPRLLSELAPTGAAVPRTSDQGQIASRATLRALPAEQRVEALIDRLRHAAAVVLRVEPAEIKAQTGLNEQGMDSLTAVELRNRIETDLGVLVPASRLLASVTPRELAADLATLMDAAVELPARSAAESEGEI